MKKISCFLLFLVLFVSTFSAFADWGDDYELHKLGTMMAADYDFDGEEEMAFLLSQVDELGRGSFLFVVGDQKMEVDECDGLNPQIYAMTLYPAHYMITTLFLIEEYPECGDPTTHFYMYDGELVDIGSVHSLIEDMRIEPIGSISVPVRTNILGSWFRNANYIISLGFDWLEDGCDYLYSLSEVPNGVYPFGMVIPNIENDIRLYASRYDEKPELTISAGQPLILVGTDEERWFYVTDMKAETCGWLKMKIEDYDTKIEINGHFESPFEVFGFVPYVE